MAQQIVFFDDTNENAATTIAGMRADFDKYGINCAEGINVSGIATFSGKITDVDSLTGTSGQVLSSTGTGVKWIAAGEGNTASATNVGVNLDSADEEQWLTFVGADNGNNPIRVDGDLRYNPNTNLLKAGNVQLPDLGKLELGGSQEFSTFYKPDTDDIRVEISAGNNYVLLGDVIDIKNAAGDKALITAWGNSGAAPGNSVVLSYDGTERIRTADGGVVVAGITTSSTFKGVNPIDTWSHNGVNENTRTAGTYALTDLTGTLKGSGAGFTVEVANDTPKTVSVTKTANGENFVVGETITLASASIGGGSNITIDIDTITAAVYHGDGTNLTSVNATQLNGQDASHYLAYANLTGTPTIPAEQIQADWDQASTSSLDFIKNKPTIPSAQVQVDWNQSTSTELDFIKNKPTIPSAQIQSDWNQNTNTELDFIKNKPTIPTNTDTTYAHTVVATLDGSNNADGHFNLKLTAGGSGSGDDSIKFFAGNNITFEDIGGETGSEDGKSVKVNASFTNYSAFTGASNSVAGAAGLVPQPAAGDQDKFLKGDGNWATDTNTWRGIDDTPVDNETDESISSNWAFDHASAAGNGGHVPAAGTGNSGKFLANDGSWKTPDYTTNTDTTYTLPVTGTDSTDWTGNGSSTLTLTAGGSGSGTDAVTISAGSNIKLTSIVEGGFTISAQNTTYSDFTGATAGTPDTAGTAGLVIQPAAGDHNKFLRGNGTWSIMNAGTITLADEATDTECFLIFSKDASGADKTLHTNAALKFNSNTDALTFTGELTAGSFVKSSNSGGFLKADGSEDTNTYLTSASGTNTTYSISVETGTSDSEEIIRLTDSDAGTDDVKLLASAPITIAANATNSTITYSISDFGGSNGSAAGSAGAVPQPAAGDNTKFLKGDGTWTTPTDTTTNNLYKLECLQTGTPADNDNPKLSLKTNGGSGSTYTELDSVQITGGTNCTVTRVADGSLTINATETSHSDVVVDGDFTSNGFMKTDGSGTYSVDTNSYSTTSHTHSYASSSHTHSYASSSHTHSYQEQLTFGSGITESSNSVSVDAAVLSQVIGASANTNTFTMDTVALGDFYLLEYSIYLNHSTAGMQAQKLLIMCDGTNHHHTEFAVMYSAALLGTFSTSTSGSNLLVRFTPVNSATSIRYIKQVINA